MFLIDKSNKQLSKIVSPTFKELGFSERNDLQEWIEKTPEVLGEDLLIIAKEFDKFDDTKERIDLLALDTDGNIVIIENKLDDTGKDVTWQALKYAAYCSTFTKDNIVTIYQSYLDKQNGNKKAKDELSNFLEEDYEEKLNKKQRIILVSKEYRKEVTSTVLWLLNTYGLDITCIKVTLYKLNEQLFLDSEQIIPPPDVKEFIIKAAEKNREDAASTKEVKERHILRQEFWKQLLKEFSGKSNLFEGINPSTDHWIAKGSGISGVTFNFCISNYYARAELYISKGNKDENKLIFDNLFSKKQEIEKQFGGELIWERLNENKACRVKYQLNDVNYFNNDDWPKMIEFAIDGMQRLEKAFKKPLEDIKYTSK